MLARKIRGADGKTYDTKTAKVLYIADQKLPVNEKIDGSSKGNAVYSILYGAAHTFANPPAHRLGSFQISRLSVIHGAAHTFVGPLG